MGAWHRDLMVPEIGGLFLFGLLTLAQFASPEPRRGLEGA